MPLQTKDLLNSLGPSADVISSQVGQLQEGTLDKLKRLRSAYTVPTAGVSKYQSAADRVSDMAPYGWNPAPREMLSHLSTSVGGTYYQEKVSAHPTARDPFSALLDKFTKRGQIIAMAIHRKNELRMSVERIAVGRVLPDKRNDGAITIETGRRSQGHSSAMVVQRVEKMADGVPIDLLKKFFELYNAQSSTGPFGFFSSGMSFDSSSLDGSDSEYGSGSGSSYGSATGPIGDFDQSSGLDTEILKLKRMIDKKTHAMELYSQTMTAYNNAAKNIIEKVRA